MSTELLAVLVAVIASTPATVSNIISNRNSKRTTFQIDVAVMRYIMINIYDKCIDKGYRTKFDDSIFYEIFGIYTKKLNQNSYICQELEPAFRQIERK